MTLFLFDNEHHLMYLQTVYKLLLTFSVIIEELKLYIYESRKDLLLLLLLLLLLSLLFCKKIRFPKSYLQIKLMSRETAIGLP